MAGPRRTVRRPLAMIVGVLLLATGCDVTVAIVSEPLGDPPLLPWQYAVHADDPACLGGDAVEYVSIPGEGGTAPVTVTVPAEGSCEITIVELNHLGWSASPGRVQRITVTESFEPIEVRFRNRRISDILDAVPTPTPEPTVAPTPTTTPTPSATPEPTSTASVEPVTTPTPSATPEPTSTASAEPATTAPPAPGTDGGAGIGFTG